MKWIIVSMLLLLSSCQTAGSYAQKGDNAYNKQRYIEAVDYYQKAIAKNDNDRYRFNMAISYLAIDQNNLAVTVLEQLYRQKPENIVVIQTLAYAYQKNFQLDEARTLYQKALDINSYNELALAGSSLLDYYEHHDLSVLQPLKSYYSYAPSSLLKKVIAKIYLLAGNRKTALFWLDGQEEALEDLKNEPAYLF